MKKEYAVLIDNKAEFSKNEIYEPFIIKATNAIDAMSEAEKYFDEKVYLIKILERKAGVEKADGCKRIRFEEILVNRGHGWKKADAEHFENSSIWMRFVSLSKKYNWTAWEIEYTNWC